MKRKLVSSRAPFFFLACAWSCGVVERPGVDLDADVEGEQSGSALTLSEPGLVVTSAATWLQVGECSPPIRVERGGAPLTAPATILLSGPNVDFFTDARCSRDVVSGVMAAGVSELIVYARAKVVDAVTLSFTASGYATATQTRNVTASTLPRALGSLPVGLVARWPAAPVITRVVEARTLSAFNAAAAVPGTHINVRATFGGELKIAASDVKVVMHAGPHWADLRIDKNVDRVAVHGGIFRSVRIANPTDFQAGVSDPAWLNEDIFFDGLTVDNSLSGATVADGIGMDLRGRRVTVLRSHVRASAYAIWSEASVYAPMRVQSEDFILAGNDFRSLGWNSDATTRESQATVRLVSMLRSISVDNRMQNGRSFDPQSKHNYRVHGLSDWNFAARNVFVFSGVYLASMAGDDLGRIWLNDNTFHQLREELFGANPAQIDSVQANRNLVYTNLPFATFPETAPPGWEFRDNVYARYQAP